MKVLIDRSFEKDVQKITDKKILSAIADCIEEIQLRSKLTELVNCKKLAGSKNCYRIRIGDYRLGFIFENNIKWEKY
jgi:mRNA interferase RelE/StbE